MPDARRGLVAFQLPAMGRTRDLPDRLGGATQRPIAAGRMKRWVDEANPAYDYLNRWLFAALPVEQKRAD